MSGHSYGNITEPSRPLDKDRLAMVARGKAAEAAHMALDAIQGLSPEYIMAGVALLYATLIQRTGLDPETEHHRGLRLLADQEGFRKDNFSLQSLKDFAGIRIMGEHNVSIS